MKKIAVRNIKHTQKEIANLKQFNIRQLTELMHGEDMFQALHRHDFYYLLIIEKGNGTHTIDFEKHKVTDCCLFMMKPGQVHEHLLLAGSKGYLMAFEIDFWLQDSESIVRTLKKVSRQNFWKFQFENFSKIYAIIEAVFQEFNEKKIGYNDIIKAMLSTFFIHLLREQNAVHHQAKKDTPLYELKRLEELQDTVEQHFIQEKSVSFYAHKMNLSAYQINAIVKKCLNKTCSQLIHEHVLLEAKRYLLTTTNQVKEIATLLGYEDPSYFIRFFRKHLGISPTEFRKNFK